MPPDSPLSARRQPVAARRRRDASGRHSRRLRLPAPPAHRPGRSDAGPAALFDTAWEGEAYNTVTGQSSNNSVRVTNEFMEAVVKNKDWNLTARTGGKTMKTIKARSLWDRFAQAAWQCADPGLQFHGTVNEWHTCPEDGEIRGSNPCSEYMFLDDTACNLASLNLITFYDENARTFDVEAYRHAVRIWTTILEISVAMAQFPSREIARKSYDYRTLGLGYANLGTLLMVMGLPYDSDEGRAMAAAPLRHPHRRGLRPIGAHGRRARSLRPLRRQSRTPCSGSSATIAGPPTSALPTEYEGLSVTPRALEPKLCPPDVLVAAQASWDEAL